MKFCSKVLNPYRLSILKKLFTTGKYEYWDTLKSSVCLDTNENQSDGKFHHLLTSLVEMELIKNNRVGTWNCYCITDQGKKTYLDILEYFKTFEEGLNEKN